MALRGMSMTPTSELAMRFSSQATVASPDNNDDGWLQQLSPSPFAAFTRNLSAPLSTVQELSYGRCISEPDSLPSADKNAAPNSSSVSRRRKSQSRLSSRLCRVLSEDPSMRHNEEGTSSARRRLEQAEPYPRDGRRSRRGSTSKADQPQQQQQQAPQPSPHAFRPNGSLRRRFNSCNSYLNAEHQHHLVRALQHHEAISDEDEMEGLPDLDLEDMEADDVFADEENVSTPTAFPTSSQGNMCSGGNNTDAYSTPRKALNIINNTMSPGGPVNSPVKMCRVQPADEGTTQLRPKRPTPVWVDKPRTSVDFQNIRTLNRGQSWADIPHDLHQDQAHLFVGQDIRGDRLAKCALPTTMLCHPHHSEIRSITPHTLVDLMDGHYHGSFDKFIVVDCRFPYEFQEGHIEGAINLWTMDQVLSHLLTDPVIDITKGERMAIVFHCEFSAKRGPEKYQYLRDIDKTITISDPHLIFPEMYVLEAGYAAFHKEYPNRCTNRQYTSEDAAQYAGEKVHFRRLLEASRAQSREWQQNMAIKSMGAVVEHFGLERALQRFAHDAQVRRLAQSHSPSTPRQ